MTAKADLVFEWADGQLRVGLAGWIVLLGLALGWWKS